LLNEEFDSIFIAKMQPEYRKFFKSILDEIVSRIEKYGSIGENEVREIFIKNKISNSELINIGITASLILSDVKLLIQNPINRVSEKTRLQNVKSIMDRNPKETAKNIFKVSSEINREEIPEPYKTFEEYLFFLNFSGKNVLERNIITMNNKIKSSTFSKVIEGIGKVTEKSNIIRSVKVSIGTTKNIENYLRNVIREQNEVIGFENSKRNGYEIKMWNTQRDEKVRSSHSQLQGVKISTNDEFVVNGETARYPKDNRLSLGQRINCRCFLTFSNQ
jgi:hypothetical protein